MVNILEKRELESTTLFYKYIEKMACPTDFAIATGLLTFRNNDKMICSHYFVNDSDEISLSQVLSIGINGEYKNISKLDKNLPGIRISYDYNDIKDNIISEYYVDENISVIEYGYFPKKLIDRRLVKNDTGSKIILPVSKYQYSKSEYKEFNIYEDNGTKFIEYPVSGMINIGNRHFYNQEKALFSIEPIRFWVDKNTGLCISQDIIMGGISYRMPKDNPYCYDDYYDSDLYEAVNVIENDIKELMNAKGKIR